MQSRMSNSQVLAQMGLDMETYEQLIGELYDGALDTRRVAESLRKLQLLFQANIVTLILRAVDEPYLSPMLAVGEVSGAGEIHHYAYYSKSTPFNNLPLDQVFTIDDLMSEA